MAKETNITWCDSTVNVHQGCRGCELWDSPQSIFRDLDSAIKKMHNDWKKGASEARFTRLCAEAYDKIELPLEGHIREPLTGNIWRMRTAFLAEVPDGARDAAVTVLEQSMSCYAGNLHMMMKSQRIDQPDYTGRKGFAPVFDRQIAKPQALSKAIHYPDLLGTTTPLQPWKDGQARSIFVDDMSDLFSEDSVETPADRDHAQTKRFQFIVDEVITPMTSDQGKKHLYFILTKRPHLAAKFAKQHGRFPPNCMVMTSITCWDNRNRKRLADIKKVDAVMRGISFEPLRGPIPVAELDLSGISWMVVGGESQQRGFETCCEFHCEWATALLAFSREHDIRFFMKQLGGNVLLGGESYPTPNAKGHGGDPRDWPDELRVQEMPREFDAYRQDERIWRPGERPVHKSFLPREEKPKNEPMLPKGFTEDDVTYFKTLDGRVKKAAEQFVAGALAMEEIKSRKLYKLGGYRTYNDYCRSVQEISSQYANKLIRAGETYRALEPFLLEKQLEPPRVESQLAVLAKVREPSQAAAVYVEVLGREQDARKVTAAKLVEAVEAQQRSTRRPPHKRKSPSEKLKEAHGLLQELRELIEHNEQTTAIFRRMERLLNPKDSVKRPTK